MAAFPETKPVPSLTERVPPLENGDRLTRAEFWRRYEAMPHVKRAELIEGVVQMPSPVRIRAHSSPVAQIAAWLMTYTASTPGVIAGSDATIRMDLENVPQPDAFLMIDPANGGQASISEDDYIEGAPELIVEVAASSASRDLHQKQRIYRRNGVQEYLVWRTLDRAIDWFCLREEVYVTLASGEDGLIRSEAFPGLVLDAEALLRGDPKRVLEAQQEALGSDAHREFVDKLAIRGQGKA